MEKEELVVKNIIDTPLSNGMTLTELHKDMEVNKKKYKHKRIMNRLIGSSLIGVGILGAATVLSQAVPPIVNIMLISAGSLLGTTHLTGVFDEKREFIYQSSYKQYYDNIKKVAKETDLSEADLDKIIQDKIAEEELEKMIKNKSVEEEKKIEKGRNL